MWKDTAAQANRWIWVGFGYTGHEMNKDTKWVIGKKGTWIAEEPNMSTHVSDDCLEVLAIFLNNRLNSYKTHNHMHRIRSHTRY